MCVYVCGGPWGCVCCMCVVVGGCINICVCVWVFDACVCVWVQREREKRDNDDDDGVERDYVCVGEYEKDKRESERVHILTQKQIHTYT